MHKKWSFSVAKLATAAVRLSMRLKSSQSRPSAPLGSRILSNPDDIFKHNMWDHVEWTDEDKENAQQKAQENASVQIPLKEQGKFDQDASQYWDKFYELHQDKFFKDRRWLFLEFPELLPSCAEIQATETRHSQQKPVVPQLQGPGLDREKGHHQHSDPFHFHRKTEAGYAQKAVWEHNDGALKTPSFPGQHASFRILEVGCGVGNSVFPIVNSIKGTNSFLYCCDFSPRAIQLVKDHPDYDNSLCHAFVYDICEEVASFPFPQQSVDAILAVFVLSSIHPDRVQGVVNRLSPYLKHGGMFLFRDYGRYDFSQLRFKKGRCLSQNFYTRGDGTCVYFFTKGEVHDLFSKAGLEEIQNLEDRRLQVNRGKKVVMRRVWMQSKYRKPHSSS
ncbi:tRNA N(3)-cytidine methyltransferase METTL8, mitochondrial isoform 1-T1 [Menidia menidia]